MEAASGGSSGVQEERAEMAEPTYLAKCPQASFSVVTRLYCTAQGPPSLLWTEPRAAVPAQLLCLPEPFMPSCKRTAVNSPKAPLMQKDSTKWVNSTLWYGQAEADLVCEVVLLSLGWLFGFFHENKGKIHTKG